VEPGTRTDWPVVVRSRWPGGIARVGTLTVYAQQPLLPVDSMRFELGEVVGDVVDRECLRDGGRCPGPSALRQLDAWQLGRALAWSCAIIGDAERDG
jgi:hypothetical protein